MRTSTGWRMGCRLAVLVGASLLAQAPRADDPQTLGWVEAIRLQPWDLVMKAKLDTGAKTAAIHATNIERFERDGQQWVRFKLAVDHRNDQGEPLVVERPLARDVTIKLRGSGKNAERPTVHLQFCLGGRRYDALFSLVNRKKFNYPVLLGRRFLAGVAAVDPARRFTADPRCPAP